jgi:hypothetical protein
MISWLIFCVAHFLRIDLDTLIVCALKINQLADGGLLPNDDTYSARWDSGTFCFLALEKLTIGPGKR